MEQILKYCVGALFIYSIAVTYLWYIQKRDLEALEECYTEICDISDRGFDRRQELYNRIAVLLDALTRAQNAIGEGLKKYDATRPSNTDHISDDGRHYNDSPLSVSDIEQVQRGWAKAGPANLGD